MTTEWAFRQKPCRTSSSGSIEWTRRARARWAARGWDCQLSKRSSRLTAVRSEWKASKAEGAGSLSSCLSPAKHPNNFTRNTQRELIHPPEGGRQFEKGENLVYIRLLYPSRASSYDRGAGFTITAIEVGRGR